MVALLKLSQATTATHKHTIQMEALHKLLLVMTAIPSRIIQMERLPKLLIKRTAHMNMLHANYIVI